MARPKSNKEDNFDSEIDNENEVTNEKEKEKTNEVDFDLAKLIQEDLEAEMNEGSKHVDVDLSKEKYVLFDNVEKRYVSFTKWSHIKSLLIYNNYRYEARERQSVYWNLLNDVEKSLSDINTKRMKVLSNSIESAELRRESEALLNQLK